jgi:hypothetical protein
MTHVFGEQDARAWAWPPVGDVEELWLIRTLAGALATADDASLEHRRHVARQIARTAEQLEQRLGTSSV